MPAPIKNIKNQNATNIFLNDYFNIIIAFVVVLVLLIAYFAVIRPKYMETMQAIKTNLEQQQRLYNSQQIKLNNLKAVADLYKKIPAADLKKFNSVLPDNYIKERLFGELEEIVTQNGFILSSVSIIDNQEGGQAVGNENNENKGALVSLPENIGVINLELSVTAIDYAGFKNLLRTMENNLRLFDVTKVSFSPGGNSASFVLSTYYYKK